MIIACEELFFRVSYQHTHASLLTDLILNINYLIVNY